MFHAIDLSQFNFPETTYNVHYDDGTRNVALTHPNVSKDNAILAMEVIYESSQAELEAIYWPGFDGVHLFVNTNKPIPFAMTNQQG